MASEKNRFKNGQTVTVCGKTFTIIKNTLGSGASFISYEAQLMNGEEADTIGILKEFMTDCENGRDELRQEIRERYKAVKRLKSDVPQLSEFIPLFDVLEDDDKLYIWMPESKKVTFEKFCEKIYKHPERKTKKMLYHLLLAVRRLTECILELHKADMRNCDITPWNFGFDGSDDSIIPQALCLFDLDTLCRADNSPLDGTGRFRDPSAKEASCKTDIYSIGRTLLYALTGPELFEKLKNDREIKISAIKDLPLLKSAGDGLRKALDNIIENCTCVYRYSNCEELLKDLNMVCDDANRAVLDRADDDSCFLASQCFLYEHPLYKILNKKLDKELYKYEYEKKIPLNIIVLNTGRYSNNIIDACLQTCQIPGTELCVNIVCENRTVMEEHKKKYLADRPELEKFFDIDSNVTEGSYGKIVWDTWDCHSVSGLASLTDDELEYLGQEIEEKFGAGNRYFFAASDSHDENRRAAEKISLLGYEAGYINIHDTPSESSRSEVPCPIYINGSIKKLDCYKELEENGFYKALPVFSFDENKMIFRNENKCDMLTYIQKHNYFTVTDMAAFRGHTFKSNDNPEFFESYRDLWQTYKDNTAVWKKLCDMLGDRKPTLSLRIKNVEEKNPPKCVYILPGECRPNVEQIIKPVKKYMDCSVSSYTTDSCRVEISDSYGNKDVFDELFSDHYRLMQPGIIEELYKRHGENADEELIEIKLSDLEVKAFDMAGHKKERKLLQTFQNSGCITGFKNSEGIISFNYGSPQIKRLFTSAGRMLEVYVYQKLRESGRFDDIESSYTIAWKNNDPVKESRLSFTQKGTENEMDCIATKGFRSLFIECKARSDIEQDFYDKLRDIKNRAGINAKAVLIAEIGENFERNKQIIEKNNDVITIYTKEEIENIDDTLLDIIEGRYKQKNT